jgi:hypothetical protein
MEHRVAARHGEVHADSDDLAGRIKPDRSPERTARTARDIFARGGDGEDACRSSSETGAIGSGVMATSQAGSRISADAGGISTRLPALENGRSIKTNPPLTNRIKPVDSAVTFPSRDARANVTLLMDAEYEWLLATH